MTPASDDSAAPRRRQRRQQQRAAAAAKQQRRSGGSGSDRSRRMRLPAAAALLFLVLCGYIAWVRVFFSDGGGEVDAVAGVPPQHHQNQGGAPQTAEGGGPVLPTKLAPAGRNRERKEDEDGDDGGMVRVLGPRTNSTAAAVAEDPESSTTTTTMEFVWDRSDRLPPWMREYFAWHAERRSKLTAENCWENGGGGGGGGDDNWRPSYLVASCLERDRKCGGLADRLRTLPFLVRLAAGVGAGAGATGNSSSSSRRRRRLLFVYWERPCRLEEFLLPPAGGGVDWRLPSFLIDRVRVADHVLTGRKLIEACSSRSGDGAKLIRSRVQIADHGSRYYNDQEERSSSLDPSSSASSPPSSFDAFAFHFPDCWRSFFTPAPALASRIRDELNGVRLRPDTFASAHVRANYALQGRGKDRGFGSGGAADGRDPSLVEKWTKNALNCLSNIHPRGPYYFASDSSYAKQVAVRYGREKGASVVAASQPARQPLHIDVVPDWKQRSPSDYYDIFVDLYVMSMSRCMTFNVGGFGRFALQLSGRNRSSCTVVHWTMGVPRTKGRSDCEWTGAELPSSSAEERMASSWRNLSTDELFFRPMQQ